jgi:hypothetical protein
MIKNQNGFGLIQVLMASAILGTLALGIMQVSKMGSENAKAIDKSFALNNYTFTMTQVIGIGAACNSLLGKDEVPSDENMPTYKKEVPAILNEVKAPIYSTGQVIQKGLSINHLYVDNLIKIAEQIYKADFNIDFKIGNKNLTKKVTFMNFARKDSNGKLYFDYCITDDQPLKDYNYSGDLEKIPPMVIETTDNAPTKEWQCQTINIKDHCADQDGCEVVTLFQHKAYYDQVRVYSARLFIEDVSTGGFSNKVVPDRIYGWTTFESGHSIGWNLGNPSTSYRYHIYSPWYWMYMSNYIHSYCPDYATSTLPFSAPNDINTQTGKRTVTDSVDNYRMSVMAHPNVKMRMIIND